MPGVTTAYQSGVHGSRPAASAGCILYSCTTHGLVYRSDGSSWTTWLTLPSGVSSASPALTFSTTASAGAASTYVATDATLPIFDATAPVTQAFSDAPAVGTAAFAARRDHKHGMPAASAGAVTLITDTLLGSDTASFDFTSIAGSYKHLMIELACRSTTSATSDPVLVRFNNDSGSNYDYLTLTMGASSSPPGNTTEGLGATGMRVASVAASSSTAGDVGNATLRIPDYASSTLNKSIHAEGGAIMDRSSGNVRVTQGFGSWRSTAAITRVTILPVSGANWKAGSRASLYGIA